ncbi:hypothetical protein BIW11_10752 [Tropilaelaps mercedesae]|uniref:Uncharacterized protein n=1 Tax=Tropilaelaps mercedesae TaxID=418985 RepID=A0A1V9XEJ3_9ACAR|nr:hypothetical protein BIW11_10752 [Tropilaelaps mercedesae]
MNSSLILPAIGVMLAASYITAQSIVYFPGAVRGVYGYSYVGYDEYTTRYRRPNLVTGGYRGGARPVAGGYRGSALPAGGYRGISLVDNYGDLESAYDYYSSNQYRRGYRTIGSGYPYGGYNHIYY